MAYWLSQYAFIDFCKILVSVANLWLQWMNECSSTMNVVDIFSYLMSKMKVKQKRPKFAIYSLFNNMSDFSAEWNNNFQIIKDYFSILCYSWYNGYRQDTLSKLIYNINIFSIIFLTINSIMNQILTCRVCLFL